MHVAPSPAILKNSPYPLTVYKNQWKCCEVYSRLNIPCSALEPGHSSIMPPVAFEQVSHWIVHLLIGANDVWSQRGGVVILFQNQCFVLFRFYKQTVHHSRIVHIKESLCSLRLAMALFLFCLWSKSKQWSKMDALRIGVTLPLKWAFISVGANLLKTKNQEPEGVTHSDESICYCWREFSFLHLFKCLDKKHSYETWSISIPSPPPGSRAVWCVWIW